MTYYRFQGSTFTVTDGTTATTVHTAVGGFLSFTHNPGSATDVDRTNAASTRRITKQGLLDSGTVEIELQRDPDDVGQAVLQAAKDAGDRRQFKWTLAGVGAPILTFYGYVKVLSLNSDTEGDAKGTCRIRVDGAMTIA